jgi:glycosyltransferase involved in cell wall biosynthesis
MSEPSPRAAIASSPLSVILTAQAIATQTGEALAAWRGYLDALKRPYEILLVQETRPEVAPTPVHEGTPHIRSFTYERTLGARDALSAAIAAAQHPLLVFCPCDGQFKPANLDGMLKIIDQVDLVVGYRAGGQAPPWRVLLDTFIGLFSRVVLGVPIERRVCWLGSQGWGRRWIARWVFGLRVLDPECPFRLARREIFNNMPLQSGGSFAQIEMLAKANHLSCYLAQEPVTWTPPAEPQSDAISFGQEAWHIFRRPEFTSSPRPAACDR